MSISRYFEGRLSRMEYFLPGLILAFIVGLISSVTGIFNETLGLLVSFVGACLMMFVSFSLMVRRLHDLGHSGWMSLLSLLLGLNVIFGLYVLFAPGQKEANKYGDVPTGKKQWLDVLNAR